MAEHQGQNHSRRLRSYGWVLLATFMTCFAGAWAHADANETIQATGALFTFILDTQRADDSPLSGQDVAAKPGWVVLEQDDTTHAFKGDAVLVNDSLALVLRGRGTGAEVYARNGGGYRLGTRLLPLDSEGKPPRQSSGYRIVENSPGTVAIEAQYLAAAGTPESVVFRLVTGQPYVQVQPAKGAASLAVRLSPSYLVVPDFFADDLVYAPSDLFTARTGLPAENFLMYLLQGGDGLVTCVWKSREQHATAIAHPDASGTTIEGHDVNFAGDAPVWVAFLEGPGVWHEQTLAAQETTGGLALDWTPPFPARWRCDFLGNSEAARSWNFEETPGTEPPPAGSESSARPCWFDGRRAYVQEPAPKPEGPAKVVVYPIDRTQGTPLNIFSFVDILRGTLGFGACQYILDLEGLDAQTSPTPALVMDWVEKQVKAGRGARSRDKIQDRLNRMVDHVTHSQARIEAYAAFAKKVRQEALALMKDTPPGADRKTVERIAGIAGEMEAAASEYDALPDPPANARKASETVLAALGGGDAPAVCQAVSERLHALGAAQDRALSKGRMAVRRINQRALDMMGSQPGMAPFAQSIRQDASVLLSDKR